MNTDLLQAEEGDGVPKFPYLSVILPAFNEQERIAETLYALKDYLDDQQYVSEILIVDDGSIDLTAEIVRVIDIYTQEFKNQEYCRLIQNDINSGKGYSIARGMELARGRFIVFIDADMPSPVSEIAGFLEQLEKGHDVVIGSRYTKGSKVLGRTTLRTVASYTFRLAVKLMGLRAVSDSQCGFKAFKAISARKIVHEQRTFGYCFDVEQLYLAKKMKMSLLELPIVWMDRPGSSISVFRDSFCMLRDLYAVRQYSERGLRHTSPERH